MTSKATPYVGPPIPMDKDEIRRRLDRLQDVIPQIEAKVDVLERKRGKGEGEAMRAKVRDLKALAAQYAAFLVEGK